MEEVCGDIWQYPADVICITTNGSVKNDGRAVMGRGVALQAKQRWPELILDDILGRQLRAGDLHVSVLAAVKTAEILGRRLRLDDVHGAARRELVLLSFPVKYRWHEAADLVLIGNSAHELADLAKMCPEIVFVLPRPGCGNGRLKWEDVKPILLPILPDNVHVITNNGS